VKAGCIAQVTAASVCGQFGVPAQKAAYAMLEEGWITVVASDAHNLEHRPPLMSLARHTLTQRYGADIADALVHDRPEAIFRA
jgi:protein-tyrosine phosphatase